MTKKRITAAEALARLNSDEEFLKRQQERERLRLQKEADLQADEKQLVAELQAAGCNVKSVWDLVNTREKYTAVIPILAQHLKRPYHPKNTEGISRALTVPEAHGAPARVILNELMQRGVGADAQVAFALANALAAAGDKSMRPEIESMIANPKFEALRDILVAVMKKIEQGPKGRNR